MLRRLMLLITLVLFASLATGSVLTYWHSITKIDVEMNAGVSVVESAVAESLGHIPDARDPRTDLDRLISAFDGDRHVRTRWVGPDGAVIKESRLGPPIDPAPRWLVEVLTEPRAARSFAVSSGGEQLGRIEIEPDAYNEVSEVWENMKLKVIIIGSFCSVVLGLIYFTLGRALKPLANLSSAIKRVGEGDYEAKVVETGPEELVAIYKQFNGMAGKLADAQRQNQRLNQQLESVQEEERADIARDLHDEIGPFLFAVDVDAQTIPQHLARGEADEVMSRAAAIRQSVTHMQRHLRSVLSLLRPAMLLDLGLAHGVEQLVAFWRARRPNIAFDVDIANESFGPVLDQIAFRIIQEATSNAVRHGKPARIAITARTTATQRLAITVSDDGAGLKPNSGGGFGISGMRERISMIGGSLAIEGSADRRGVVIRAELPLTRDFRITPAHEHLKAGAA